MIWKRGFAAIFFFTKTQFECTYSFPEVAVNAIMFQRGVHAAKSFKLQDFCNVDIFMLIGDAGFQMKETVRSLKGKANAHRDVYQTSIHLSFSFLFS